MVCVDTDFIAGLDRRNDKAIARLETLGAGHEPIYTTTVSVAELYHGAYKTNDPSRLVRVKNLLSRFHVLDLDYGSATIWGELAEKLKSNGIGDLDLFIASIALANGHTLITRNIKHFERMPGLTVESW